MANDRKGAYAEVEGLKKGKHRIARDYRRLELVLAILFAFISLVIFTDDFFSKDAFYYSIMDFKSGKGASKNFDYVKYLIIGGVVLYYFYNFFDGSMTKKILNFILYTFPNKLTSIIGAKRLNAALTRKNIEPTVFSKIFNSTIGFISFKVDKTTDLRGAIFILLFDFPIRALGKIIYIPVDLQENLAFEGSYMNKLKDKFFYQIIQTEDGLIRAKKLTIFDNRNYLFGKENCNRIKSLFRSPELFDDLFFIIEGYLDSGLYDKKIYLPSDDIYPDEYCKKYNLPPSRNYKYFQSYLLRKDNNGEYKDSVVLSLNAIRIYMFDKRKQYSNFLNEIFSINTGISSITNDFAYRILTLCKDIHFRKKMLDFVTNEYKNGTLNFSQETTEDELKSLSKKQRKEREKALKEAKKDMFRNKISEIEKILDKGVLQFETISKIRRQRKNIKATMLPQGVKVKLAKKHLGQQQNNFNIFETELITHLKNMMIADFSLVLFKIVMGQYMNLPAGIMVVKIEDYSTRMILEYYKQFCEIEIVEKRNDGQSKEFESDNYVNLFLQSYAAFCNQEEKTKFFSELYFKFNTMEYIKPYNEEEIIKMIDTQGYNETLKADKEQQEDNQNTFIRNNADRTVFERHKELNSVKDGENSNATD
ncbi:hypothetical protein [Campylobacter sp. JMF_03 NE3]|uniref:hypothetical protein n=1 Tax=Campylobacter sp. JMF_03 NE3 TaxID=2983831 RepID=UPI0022E9CCDA|nr:hypothetical protein [Campylobacter sp. JMF_03 NE3]MDA3053517.1 hypothetical protein [Campylobacter sp. JMF_03 NE3]